jgi:hypothetical protein
MEPQQQEPTLEESIKQVMQTLPPPIRNYLGQGKYSIVAKNLMTKYGLHVDQGSILEREIMLLLMGIDTPEEFTQSLAEEANLSQQTISSIVQEVNTQIFMPLQEEMKREVATAPSARPVVQPTTWKASVPQPPRPAQVNASVPSYSYTPPTQTSQHFHLDNKIPPPPRSVQINQRPVNIGRLLEDHEEPHIDFNRTPMSPRAVPPPPNLPGAMPPQTIPPGVRFSPIAHDVQPSSVIPKIESQIPPASVKPISSTPPELAKSYVDDPYREPIDEK